MGALIRIIFCFCICVVLISIATRSGWKLYSQTACTFFYRVNAKVILGKKSLVQKIQGEGK